MENRTKRAILFLNLGGPERQADVKPFLYRLFSDPEIIRIPFTPLRKFVAWLISTSREKASQQMYMKIGGGSPIRKLTDQQAAATQAALAKTGHDALVLTAFNCSAPLVEDVVKDLAKQGIEKILAFPLYPQYSISTTKGALDRARAAVRRFLPSAKLSEIHSWPTHPLFLQAHAELLRNETNRFLRKEDNDIQLVFSAHSIPENLVTKLGDPYRDQMEQTVRSIVDKAKWKGPWTLAWQSKLGPIKWLEPSTDDTVIKLGKSGVKQIVVLPVAFVTDHIETLFELDQETAEHAKESGVEDYRRVPGLNDHPIFIDALADIARGQKEFWS